MKKTPLDRRIEAFHQLGTGYNRVTPLTFCWKIPELRFSALQAAVFEFLGGRSVAELDRDRATDQNVTPNGLVVPKCDRVLEYNLVVRRFAEIINAMAIGHLIESWHVPLNVRVKYGEFDAANLDRDHPTEHLHSDSWAGESAESVTVHIPLFGDVRGNHLAMAYPPPDFEESWLGPRVTYVDGSQDIAHRYQPVDFVTPWGSLMLMDFATLHASTLAKDAKTRVSIDTTFVLRKPGVEQEVLHRWRAEERVSHEVLSSIGETHLLYFPDGPGQRVDSRGGFKHPTNLRLLRLGEEVCPRCNRLLVPGRPFACIRQPCGALGSKL